MSYKPVNAAIVMVVGPCIDDTDFKSLEESITYDAAGMDVSLIVEKTDGTSAVTAITLTTGGTSDWTHKDGGYYEVEVTAAQNTEEGIAYLRGVCTGVLPFESPRYDIEKANIYDSLRKGTDNLQVDVTQLLGTAWLTPGVAGTPDVNTKTATATALDLILKDSTFALAIKNAVWDAILTGVTFNIPNSAGRRVREIGAFAIESGTAQAGNGHSITLAAGASASDGIYNRNLIVLTDNTGAGQTRTIVDYNGTTKVCVIDRDWRVSPDATTEYQVVPDDTPLTVDHGVAQGGTSTTITIRDYASSVDDAYLCNIVTIIAGEGRGQARLVGAYDGTTKIATICGDAWVEIPDTTSIYVMMPYGTTCTSCIGTSALGLIKSEADDALTDYDPLTRTEATSDKAAIIVEVDANETKIDTMQGNVTEILTDTDVTIPGTITTLQTDSTAIKAKTDNLPSGITKNVALSDFNFYMVLSSDHVTEATGKTIVGTVSKDGGAFAALTNAISEMASGMYKVDLTQAEMNADVVSLKFTETDCDQRIITIYTS